MRNFRRASGSPLWGTAFQLLKEQRFLNLRTYVRYRDEPGAYFIHGWLSRPLNLPLPDEPFGLTCAFAAIQYVHTPETGSLRGCVRNRSGSLAYHATATSTEKFRTCEKDSLAEFALERYSGFYNHHGQPRVFRAWHAPWLVTPVELQLADDTLVTARFPWFRNAKFQAAAYAPGFEMVLLGRAHRLNGNSRRHHHHGASAFFEMP